LLRRSGRCTASLQAQNQPTLHNQAAEGVGVEHDLVRALFHHGADQRLAAARGEDIGQARGARRQPGAERHDAKPQQLHGRPWLVESRQC
jgi:hypothetical protein